MIAKSRSMFGMVDDARIGDEVKCDATAMEV